MTKLITSGLLLGLAHTAFATVGAINVTNTDGIAQINNIADSGGTRLTTANSSFYLGVMDETKIAGATSVANMFSHFQLFDAITSGVSNPIVADGYFLGDAQADFAPVNTKSIYVFIANHADASSASATEALVWKLTGGIFSDNANPAAVSPQDFDMIAANGTALFGFDAAGNADYQLSAVSAVPEPSSTALLGLGSVALLLRRRR